MGVSQMGRTYKLCTKELHQQQKELGQQTEHLIQDVSTRWNSTPAIFSRLLKNQEAIKATLSRQKHKLAMLTASEWDKLQRLETLLKPSRLKHFHTLTQGTVLLKLHVLFVIVYILLGVFKLMQKCIYYIYY